MFRKVQFDKKAFARKLDLLSRFGKDENGGFAVIFGISITALMLSAGVAFDYTRLAQTKSIMDNALDAAILSAGHELSNGETSQTKLKNVFDVFFNANLQQRSLSNTSFAVTDFSVNAATGEIKASVEADVQMGMMSIAGYDKIKVGSVSEAIFDASDFEVAMMLDVTGSMGEDGKLKSMKLAAADAVDILLKNGAKSRTRVGLVPYASSVNAGPYAFKVTGGASSRCVTERSRDTYNDTYYTISPIAADSRANCPDNEIVPLSRDAGSLKNRINAYNADGYTAGHLGVSWSYYMLSQKWKNLWRGAEPANYGDAKKIAILMTDGEFNTYYDGTQGNSPFGGHKDKSSDTAKRICQDMKKKKGGKSGIIIYSVAFNAPIDAEKTLKACASPDSDGTQHYFSASNEAELRGAFRKIARNIQKLRLSR